MFARIPRTSVASRTQDVSREDYPILGERERAWRWPRTGPYRTELHNGQNLLEQRRSRTPWAPGAGSQKIMRKALSSIFLDP